MIERYAMVREQDATGTSGTGFVAEVAVFDDGTCIVHWSGATNAQGVTSTVVYASLEDAIKVHGHNGMTKFMPYGQSFDFLRERFASLAHLQWRGWMEYFMGKCSVDPVTHSLIVPAGYVTALQRQMDTAYIDLSEEEKNSDRREADRFLEIVKQWAGGA